MPGCLRNINWFSTAGGGGAGGFWPGVMGSGVGFNRILLAKHGEQTAECAERQLLRSKQGVLIRVGIVKVWEAAQFWILSSE